MKTICISLFVMLGIIVTASGQPSRTNINPALLYYQTFLAAPEPISDEDDAYLYTREGHRLPERYGDIVARYDYQFMLLRKAMRSTAPCDWGIDQIKGPYTLLPHLARVKAAAQVARVRVMWNLQHQRQAEACDDLLASFVLARNASRDGTLISSMVQSASQVLNCCTVAANFGRFSQGSLKELMDGFDAAPAQGTVAACVSAEVSTDWLVGKIQELQKSNPSDDAKAMAGIRKLLTGLLAQPQDEQPVTAAMESDRLFVNANSLKWWNPLSEAAGGTSEGILKILRSDSFENKLTTIMALPQGEYESQMQQLKAETTNSPNPFLSLHVAAFERARSRELRSLVYVAMVRAAVEYRLHGETAFQSVKDPCGKGPFGFRRFVFEGVDRGFELKSECNSGGFPETLIFVEKIGPGFRIHGKPGIAGAAMPSANIRIR